MSKKTRGRPDAVLKAKVALEALRNAATVAELGAKYQLHPAMTRAERVAMVDRGRADLSMRRQCALLGLARSGIYRRPAAPDPEELGQWQQVVKSVADPAAKVKAIEPAVGTFWSPGPHIQSIYLNDLDSIRKP
jgi:transposase